MITIVYNKYTRNIFPNILYTSNIYVHRIEITKLQLAERRSFFLNEKPKKLINVEGYKT